MLIGSDGLYVSKYLKSSKRKMVCASHRDATDQTRKHEKLSKFLDNCDTSKSKRSSLLNVIANMLANVLTNEHFDII